MNNIEFLKGWKKNFVTISLEQYLFKDENDEINKITKLISIFSPSKIKLKFNIEDNDQFSKEFLSNKNYDYKIIHTGKRFFSRKKYSLIEMNSDLLLANNIISLAVKYKNTIDLELIFDNQSLVLGVLYGDAGETHSIHFNSEFFNIEEIKNKINNIFN